MNPTHVLSHVQINHRFCGPPSSGNGGYSCGLLAQHLDGPVQVTLRQPPPLDTDLMVVEENGLLTLKQNDQLIAEARQTTLSLEVPAPPDDTEVTAAAAHFAGFDMHIFPRCFVCGPERKPGDGLRIFAGPCDHSQMVAAPWVPDASLEGSNGEVAIPFIWSALDCPGYFASVQGESPVPALLGQMTADILKPVRVGDHTRIIGWKIHQEGRKRTVGTALFNGNGELCAQAQALWIELRQRPASPQ